MTIFDTVILGIIEGFTEFLPISSTGHMVIASHFMRLETTDFLKAFEVIIQFGAILSVLVIYFKKLKANPLLIKWLIFAFIPTGIVGFLLKSKIDELLDSAQIVAWALILGGLVLIWMDRWYEKAQHTRRHLGSLNLKDSISLGLFQCVAMIPGVSRSGATIFGAMWLKYDKKDATEFSFLLALPTLTAATLYKLLKIRHQLHSDQAGLLLLGSVLAFVIAWFSIQFFIRIVGQYGFKFFGYYRIILGALVLFFG